jgi:hypothetical protein
MARGCEDELKHPSRVRVAPAVTCPFPQRFFIASTHVTGRIGPVTTRSQQAWLLRRAGFGPAAGELDRLASLPVGDVLDALLDPDGHGVAPAPDPWAGLDLAGARAAEGGRQVVARWLQAMATTPRPLAEWMRWFWHGHFVSTLPVVKQPQLLVDQLRLFGRAGLGDFRSLLAAVTTDAAMLVYLDGAKSTRGQVNENYGREVLELFALGIGAYTEADVRAGAVALTGWAVPGARESATGPRFVARRHDDTPQRYLGRDGVHDVDTAVDAMVAHPACAPFVTGKLARALLGPDVDTGLVASLAADFARSGLALAPLVRAILEAGLDGHATTLVRGPVPWLAAMIRASGADAAAAVTATGGALRAAGQVPLNAPNVGGWPGGRSWLSSSATVGRWNMAVALAAATPAAAAARSAAARGAWAELADVLGQPDGFAAPTVAALDQARDGGPRAGNTKAGRAGDTALTLALASPDLVLA